MHGLRHEGKKANLGTTRAMQEIEDLIRYNNEQLPGKSAMQKLAKEWDWVRRPDLIKEGKQIGLKEGRQIGLKEGRQQKALDIAEKLLQKGWPAQKISSITGLDVGQIDAVRNDRG